MSIDKANIYNNVENVSYSMSIGKANSVSYSQALLLFNITDTLLAKALITNGSSEDIIKQIFLPGLETQKKENWADADSQPP